MYESKLHIQHFKGAAAKTQRCRISRYLPKIQDRIMGEHARIVCNSWIAVADSPMIHYIKHFGSESLLSVSNWLSVG